LRVVTAVLAITVVAAVAEAVLVQQVLQAAEAVAETGWL
jgi:hypothetical protein